MINKMTKGIYTVANDVVFDQCFTRFGRGALTRELMVQFFISVVPILQKQVS